MEFRIKHTSGIFRFGPITAFVIFIGMGLLYGSIAFFLQDNEVKAELFLVFLFITLAMDGIYLLLFFLEKIVGAKLIINHDHIIIRKMLRRRRKLFFTDIVNARYSHDDTVKNAHYLTSEHAGEPSEMMRLKSPANRPPEAIAQLVFETVSGERFRLIDHADAYNRMRGRAMVDPSVDPDADVLLYQAYQCYCAAVDQYARENNLQIPR